MTEKTKEMLTFPFGAGDVPVDLDTLHDCAGCDHRGQIWGAQLVGSITGALPNTEHRARHAAAINTIHNAVKAATVSVTPELMYLARANGKENKHMMFGTLLLALHEAQVQIIDALCDDYHPMARGAALQGVQRALLLGSMGGTREYHGLENDENMQRIVRLMDDPIPLDRLVRAMQQGMGVVSDDDDADTPASIIAGLQALRDDLPSSPQELTVPAMQALHDRAVALAAKLPPQLRDAFAAQLARSQQIIDDARELQDLAAIARRAAEASKSDTMPGSGLESLLRMVAGDIANLKEDAAPAVPSDDANKSVTMLEFDHVPTVDELADIIYGQIKEANPTATITRANIVTAIREGKTIQR